MENKTAEEIAIESLQPLTNQILTEDSWLITSVTKLMRDHASLQCAEIKKQRDELENSYQGACHKLSESIGRMSEFQKECAEMKEENEKLRGALVIANENTKRRGETISQLQEEVERLKGVLKESKDTILYLVSEYANGTSMAAEETLTSINRTLR